MNIKHQSFINTAIGLSVLGLGGCLAIYSARALGEAPLYFVFRQLLWLGCGVIFFLLLAWIPFHYYIRYARHLAAVSFLFLVLVLFFGTKINGMSGWFSVGGLFLIQPSEFAKAPFLLLLSVYATEGTASPRRRVLKMFGLGIAFCTVILLEPDFGTATVYFSALAVVLFVSGFQLYFLFALLGAALPCTFFFLLNHQYALARISGYLNPDTHMYGAGWHIKQFQYTLAHGGLLGSEWGGAIWSGAYLPFSHSDSAFAAIIEAGGVAGGLIIIAGFLTMVFFFRRLALRNPQESARILIFSVGAVCAVQALLHIGVNTALLPPTGLTLPIFSYGGSSLFGTMAAFGLACSASNAKFSQTDHQCKKITGIG